MRRFLGRRSARWPLVKNVSIKEIMKTDVATVFEDDSFSKVEEKFKLRKIRHLPVIDKRKKLVGIISERDLYRTVAPHKTEEGYLYDRSQLDQFILKYIMTSQPFTLHPEDTFKDALEAMANRKYGCIPVTNSEGILVGIVTRSDVLGYVAKHLL